RFRSCGGGLRLRFCSSWGGVGLRFLCSLRGLRLRFHRLPGGVRTRGLLLLAGEDIVVLRRVRRGARPWARLTAGRPPPAGDIRATRRVRAGTATWCRHESLRWLLASMLGARAQLSTLHAPPTFFSWVTSRSGTGDSFLPLCVLVTFTAANTSALPCCGSNLVIPMSR